MGGRDGWGAESWGAVAMGSREYWRVVAMGSMGSMGYRGALARGGRDGWEPWRWRAESWEQRVGESEKARSKDQEIGTYEMIIDEWLQEEEEPAFDNTEINTLITAWINEKTSPELLAFQELFSKVLEKCEAQSLLLDTMSQERSILELEISRLQYIIKSYFRKRLEKIEKYAFYYEFNESFKLSMQEQQYLKEYLIMTKEYLLESGLETFPKALHAFDDYVGDLNMIASPNLNQAVVCKVLENIGEVMINESESIYMEKDNIYILKYKTVQSLLEKGFVKLL